MKKLTTAILLLTIFLSYSQIKVDSTDYRYYYQKVFEVEGKKDVLRENANAWIVKNYRNTNEGIKMNTGENLIAKGNFKGVYNNGLGGKSPCTFSYVIEISFKDGRYRLTINDIIAKTTQTGQHHWMANLGIIAPIQDEKTFRDIHVEFAENTIETGKKMIVNSLNNPNKISKHVKRHQKYHEIVYPQILHNFNETAKSLHDYMKSKKKDDW